MRRWARWMIGAVLLLYASIVFAGSLQGPVITTSADVTCPNGSATVAQAASTPGPGSAGVNNQLCTEFAWVSGSPNRIGDANVGTARGHPMAASTGANFIYCGDAAVSCFGVGGTSVISITGTNRQ